MATDEDQLLQAWYALGRWPKRTNTEVLGLQEAVLTAIRQTRCFASQDAGDVAAELVLRVAKRAAKGNWPAADTTSAMVMAYLKKSAKNLRVTLLRAVRNEKPGAVTIEADVSMSESETWDELTKVRLLVEARLITGDLTLGPTQREARMRHLNERLLLRLGHTSLSDLIGLPPSDPAYRVRRNALDQRHGRLIEHLQQSLARWRRRHPEPMYEQDFKHMQGFVAALSVYEGKNP